MRFNEIIENQLEVDDEVIEDYIRTRDKENIIEYTVEDFIQFFTTEYYVEDFIEINDTTYTLKRKDLLEEINRVKEQIGIEDND